MKMNLFFIIFITFVIGCKKDALESKCIEEKCSDTIENEIGVDSPVNEDEEVVESKESEFKVLPLKITKLSFEGDPNFSSVFTLEKFQEKFVSVNEIWKKAGIQFEITGIREIKVGSADFPKSEFSATNREFRMALDQLVASNQNTFPLSPIQFKGEWHILVFRHFPKQAGGVNSSTTGYVYLSELNDGVETHDNIYAHELGHTLLGSSHFDPNVDPTNLMVAGGNDVSQIGSLTDAQIEDVQKFLAQLGI